MRRREPPALPALLAAVRIVRPGVLPLREQRRLDLAAAAERADDLAVCAELIARARERRHGMLTRGIRAVRLEKADARAVHLRQVLEHQRIRRTEAQPIAEQHHIIVRHILRRLLHAEHIAVRPYSLRHRLGNLLRIPRHGRINNRPFPHRNILLIETFQARVTLRRLRQTHSFSLS